MVNCPLVCITCQSLKTTAIVWDEGPVLAFAEESGRIVSSFDAANANATVATCADIMAAAMYAETAALLFEWDFLGAAIVRYDFNDLSHSSGEEKNVKLARQSFCATWAFGEPNMMVHFDGAHGFGLTGGHGLTRAHEDAYDLTRHGRMARRLAGGRSS